ncbi:hypothetical protein BC829DRAFT_384411 [Chytridium lagenaria]|nr:hypothetical protein BC829DRAFT_384411 [Chytridium lagenaria]
MLVVQKQVPDIELDADVPPTIADLITSCISLDPAARPTDGVTPNLAGQVLSPTLLNTLSTMDFDVRNTEFASRGYSDSRESSAMRSQPSVQAFSLPPSSPDASVSHQQQYANTLASQPSEKQSTVMSTYSPAPVTPYPVLSQLVSTPPPAAQSYYHVPAQAQQYYIPLRSHHSTLTHLLQTLMADILLANHLHPKTAPPPAQKKEK